MNPTATLPLAHLSIHDLAPHTLDVVGDMLARLKAAGHPPAMLLVIPGLDWTPAQLQQLRNWAQAGHPLAGHGWRHQVAKRRGLVHTLHGMLISRHVAEHLALPPDAILELMHRCHQWFAEHDLPSPAHYVPPAWALGRVSPVQLATLPFQSVETLRGVWYPSARQFEVMPLLGFEADTRFRAAFLRLFNACNRLRSRHHRITRIALHPYDLELELAKQILPICQRFRLQAHLPGLPKTHT